MYKERLLIILATIVIFLPLFILYRKKYKFLFYIPLINCIVGIFNIYFYEYDYILSNIITTIILIFIIYIWMNEIKLNKINIFIFLFFLYLLILFSNSSNIINSLRRFRHIFISMMMFPVSYVIIINIRHIKKVNNIMIIVLFLTIINILIGILFHIGRETYYGGTKELLTGNLIDSKLFPAALGIVLLPIIYPLENHGKKLFITILSIFAVILLAFTMRRTVFLIITVGYFIYFIYSKQKLKILLSTICILIIIISLFPIYKNPLLTRFSIRADQGKFSRDFYYNEIRYVESIYVLNKIFSFHDIKYSLFGKEVLNSEGNYCNGIYGERPLHLDFNVILNGSGILGLLIYILIYYKIYRKFIFITTNLSKNGYIYSLKNMFISFFIISIIVSILNGGIWSMPYRSVIFIYLGGILRILEESNKNTKIYTNV